MQSARLYPLLLLLGCLFAMAVALTTQYGFGLPPCPLCIYQRIPYVTAGVLAAIALAPFAAGRIRVMLTALCALAFAVDAGTAFFHVGVEQHWWAGLESCTGGAAQAQSVEDLKALLAGPPPPACDQIPWSVFGVSMAGYNGLFALALTCFALWATLRLKELS
jgi:disulfide bond formation protein DsbB